MSRQGHCSSYHSFTALGNEKTEIRSVKCRLLHFLEGNLSLDSLLCVCVQWFQLNQSSQSCEKCQAFLTHVNTWKIVVIIKTSAQDWGRRKSLHNPCAVGETAGESLHFLKLVPLHEKRFAGI